MKRVVLLLLLSASAFAQDVTLDILSIERPASAQVVVVSATVTNHLPADIADFHVEAMLNFGANILAGQSDAIWSCRDAGTLTTVNCTAATLPANTTVPLTLYIDAQVGRFRVIAHGVWPGGDTGYVHRDGWVPHDVHVTHDGDAGEGSLRNAIRLANEDCEGLLLPCRIVFDDAMTIRPLTPLPVIWGPDVSIDGGGRVILDGAEVGGGSGLEIEGSGWNTPLVRGLTIRAFPWDGVHVNRPDAATITIEDCTIEENGSRGVTAEARTSISVLRNRIRHNARSGIFALGINTLIEENVIEENGASGVFVDGDFNVRVVRNRIAGNAQFGVAASRHIITLDISENSIARNRISGIDRGLDGSDGTAYDDLVVANAYIPPPVITEARYDAATNTTTIRGTYFDAQDHWGRWSLELFSNSAAEAQGETYLGRTEAANGAFAFVAQGDLRDRFITATGRRYLNLGFSGEAWWTSEFAEVIQVR